MTDFEVEDHVTFAGGQGQITNVEERPNGGHLLHVYTTDGQLRKLPSGLPHIEKVDSIVDRLKARQVITKVPSIPRGYEQDLQKYGKGQAVIKAPDVEAVEVKGLPYCLTQHSN